jgi:Lon protease-like protein
MLPEQCKSSCVVQSVEAPEVSLSPLLPLFPLDLVLLPGNPLPLHIFEPRYKELIGECLDGNKTFGIVRTKEEGIADIGCTAEIVEVTKKYPDGRLDILTAGRRRFEVLAVDQERSFLRAEVMYLEDEPRSPSVDQADRALQLRSEIMQLAGMDEDSRPDEPSAQLSFHIAGPLPLDPDFKQSLLVMRSEADRMESLVTYLEAIVPRLRKVVQARTKAGGNGHIV